MPDAVSNSFPGPAPVPTLSNASTPGGGPNTTSQPVPAKFPQIPAAVWDAAKNATKTVTAVADQIADLGSAISEKQTTPYIHHDWFELTKLLEARRRQAEQALNNIH